MNTLLKPLQVRETLLQKKVRTFTTHDFENIFRTTPTKTKSLLETQTTQGLLIRLKRGVYALKTDLPSREEIANSLYRPS
jgi:predicted transcriptional regulator of viral defense system